MIETKRGYITKAEVESYCDIAITDDDEAIERMELAEELIDQYVGFQNKFLRYEVDGIATDGTTTTLIDTSGDSLLDSSVDGRYEYCTIQVLSGTNAGEERLIIDHDVSESTIEVHEAFTSAIDDTSVYRIYQLAKFPRAKDVKIIDNVFYKYVPEQVKKAALAQVDYMLEMGDDFFNSGVDKNSENIDGYDYEVPKSVNRMIAPKARTYLKGIMSIKGKLLI